MAIKKAIELIIEGKNKTKTLFASVGSSLSDLGSAAKTAGIAIGAALVAGFSVLSVIVKKNLDEIDNLAKTASALGIGTEELQQLRLAAELSGLSVSGLDNALKTFVKRTGEAATGTGLAKDALEALGLSAKDLAGKNPAEAFKIVIAEVEKLDNVAQRADILASIFGKKEGIALANLTISTLDEARQALDDFDFGISPEEAATVEGLNDQLTKLGAFFGGLGTKITLLLAEPISKFVSTIKDAVSSGTVTSFIDQVARVASGALDTFTDLVAGTGKITGVVEVIKGSFAGIFGAFQVGFGAVTGALSDGLGGIVSTINAVTFDGIPGLVELEQQIKDFGDAAQETTDKGFQNLKEGADDVVSGFEKLTDPTKEAAKEIESINEAAQGAASNLESVADESDKVSESNKQLAESSKESADAIQKQREEAAKTALEFEKIASNERIKNIELAVGIRTEQIQADAKIAVQALESIGNTVTNTGDLLGGLFDNLGNAGSFRDRFKITDQISQENKRRDDAFKLQKDLTEAEIDLVRERTRTLRNGDGLITVTSDGLEPELELILFKVLEKTQIRVNEEASELLLGVS